MSVLPISDVVEDVITQLIAAPQVILHAPPGAGKSTWLPLELLRGLSLPGKIILLEPRRLAAKNVALRLAELLDEDVGKTIGYRMRGEQRISAATRIEVVTEGVLTRWLQQDPLLEGISLVILDEFHERSLQADLALALLLDVQQSVSDDLSLLIMSATLDNLKLSSLLPTAPIIHSVGRSFPVERFYCSLPNNRPFASAIAQFIVGILSQEAGSLLVFLPGEREIKAVQNELAQLIPPDTDLYPLFGGLSLVEQQHALVPAQMGRRKVVLATNIAETSLTIEGISLVIDSVLERASYYDMRTGTHSLETQWISQSSMTQRAGRAGRLSPGKCWHLLSQEQAERLAEQSSAEIVRSDLSGLLLNVLAWGCQDITELAWLDPLPSAAISQAKQQLRGLGAITPEGRLTPLGQKIALVGTEPKIAAMLVQAQSCTASLNTASLLAAIIEQPERRGSGDLRDSFARPQQGWLKRARQLATLAGGQFTSPTSGYELSVLLNAFSSTVAYRRGDTERYQLANGRGASLSRQHPLAHYTWLVVVQLQKVANRPEASIQLAFPTSLEEIKAVAPHLILPRHALEWDATKSQFRVWQQQALGEIIISTQPGAQPPQQELVAAFLSWVRQKGLSVLPWEPAAEQLRIRIACARQWLAEYSWPAMDDESLLATLEQWLEPVLLELPTLGNFARINLHDALHSLLSWEQRKRLESELPSRITVATGSRLAIHYQSGQLPSLAVRVQEMYGQQSTPMIAAGRIPLVLELLSPAKRPIQVTQDLAGFWRGSWREVQKEMKGRYPKHLWPDDPANTPPTTRTRQRTL